MAEQGPVLWISFPENGSRQTSNSPLIQAQVRSHLSGHPRPPRRLDGRRSLSQNNRGTSE